VCQRQEPNNNVITYSLIPHYLTINLALTGLTAPFSFARINANVSGEITPVIKGDAMTLFNKLVYQRRYRKQQAKKKVVRLELQVDATLKQAFETMVAELAGDYTEPFNERGRKARARRELFEKGITQQSILFEGCEARIDALKQELAAVSPQFFTSTQAQGRPLPQAIAVLPDTPDTLKSLLAEYYQRALTAEAALKEAQGVARRAIEYREVQDVKMNKLEARLKEAGISMSEYDVRNV
jgi:hypothetical protein